MKIIRRQFAALLMTLSLLATSAFAQSSPRATSTSPAVDKSQVIARLLKEIDAGRLYVSQLEERERSLTDEVAKGRAALVALTDAQQAALLELGELRATIRFQKAALAEREEQAAALRKEVAETRAERDSARAEVKSLKSQNRQLKGIFALVVAAAVYAVASQ